MSGAGKEWWEDEAAVGERYTLNAAIRIRNHIDSALALIEEAIESDPSHVDWYIGAKEELQQADSSISFCIND